MGINLNDHDLGGLAGYQFKEGNEKLMEKGHNVETNDRLLAVNSKSKQIVILEKKDLTLVNKIKSLFGKGPLAHLDYDFFTIGKFVESKVREIKISKGCKNFQDLTFTDGSKSILENIYAIANRMKFVHSNWDSDLFDLVSKDVDQNPRVLLGESMIYSLSKKIKTNPGMNARFLSLYVKNKLAEDSILRNVQEIRLSDKNRPRAKGVAPTAQTYSDYLSGQKISLTDKVTEIGRLIIKM